MSDGIVKCEGADGKLLFEWNPVENSISIVRKNTFYRLQLYRQGSAGRYKIIEQCPKNQRTDNPNNR